MEEKRKNPLWDSSLSTEERIRFVLESMTPEEKCGFLSTRHPAIERLGVPAFCFGGEAAHGVEARNDQNLRGKAEVTTSFSQPVGMCASWDTELTEAAGEVVGTEARALFNRHPDGGLSRWAPTVDMERDPRWGRTEEGYGEDPLLAGKMASAYIRGMQGKEENYLKMAASVKHFYANNVEDGRVWKSSCVDPRNKYEYYLEPFRRAVEEGRAEGMMTAYNEINGVPAILNREVQKLVKEKWGLPGHVVCDGGDMSQTVEFHHYYESHAQTVAEALKAGIDCFTDDPALVEAAAREAYEKHLITEMDLDRALTNSFRTKIRLGLYEEQGKNPYAQIGEDDLNTKKARAVCRKMAQESAVLLKNEGAFLPLDKAERIALIGPVGDSWFQDWYGGEPPYRVSLKAGVENAILREIPFENGLDHIVLKAEGQYVGLDERRELILAGDRKQAEIFEVNDWGFGSVTLYVPALKKYVSLCEEGCLCADKDAPFGWFVKENFRLEETAGGLRIYGWNGCGITLERRTADKGVAGKRLCAGEPKETVLFEAERIRDGAEKACELAARADKVIVALGCNPVINSKEEIDRSDLILPPQQEKLIQKVHAVNPNVVLMLLTNYPYAIGWEQENLPAILQMSTGSQEMGNGAADVLFGKVSPAGRLPLTWYASVKDLPDMDDYDIIKGKRTYRYFDKKVLYPFGYGLTYTSFTYSGLRIVQEREKLKCCVTVRNTGTCASDEVVQLYAKRISPSRILHPEKRLIGFERIRDVGPGESRHVEWEIPCSELSVYDVIAMKKIVEEGEYLFRAGGSSDIDLAGKITDACRAPKSDGAAACRLMVSGEKTGLRDPHGVTYADHYDDYENIVLRHNGGGDTCAAVLGRERTGQLIYRDFACTGKENGLTLLLRSKTGGSVRAKMGKQKAVWRGQQPDFARISLPFADAVPAGVTALYLELSGDIELEGFYLESGRKTDYNTFSGRICKLPFGGDYNPEQWPEEIWQEDMRLFRLAGIDCVTLNVFSWAALQPSEDTYCFEKLDRIMELADKNNLKVILATSTGAHPAWMAKKYPEVTRTGFNGMKRKFGDRHNSCPNSPVFQKYAGRLAEKLAQRYRTYDNIIAWHVSNEYGGECYCENCEKAFRRWLQKKYGTIDALNRAWNTAFWGHTFYDWEEIVAPNLLSEHFEANRTTFQGISLDYRRFFSDSLLDNYRLEYERIKAMTPDIPVTTNLMGFYKPLDYQKWAKYLDFVSWDNYPANEAPPSAAAMNHDLMRSLKQGAPFVLMEQTPSVTNWLSYNALKRPGVMRLWSWQAVAHGSDSILFFQMRRSIGACEKYHGAVIDHAGHEYTRVFREVRALGKELEQLGGEILGSRIRAKAAILVDWDNWWALEYSAGPSRDLKYLDEVQRYYDAFFAKNIPVDVISAEDCLENYSLVVAPLFYMVKNGYEKKLERFVKNGGTFVTTFFSGIVEEHDLVCTGGYPGKLRDLLGIWVEETDALPKDMKNGFWWNGRHYDCELLCDILYTQKAEALAFYEKDFYAGTPVLTKNRYGAGSAWYVASRAEQDFYADFVGKVSKDAGIVPVWEEIPGVEVCIRENETHRYLFFLNHSGETVRITPEEGGDSLLDKKRYEKGESFVLEKKGVMILRRECGKQGYRE